jgi:hypothetical protein
MSMSATSDPARRPPAKRLGGASGHGWRPGQSGNAGGRPKNVVNVQELARSHTEAAIETLVDALRDPRLKVQAAVALLERGWGKPLQPVVTNDDGADHWSQHLLAARLIAAELRTEREVAEQHPVIDATAEPLPPDLSAPALE